MLVQANIENSRNTRKGFIFWCGLSLVVHLVSAYFSLGFHHYDEHYQILEFAGLKLGWATPSSLPWEYSSKLRPALQPMIAYAIIKLLNLSDPFNITLILRTISGILGWAVLWFFLSLSTKYIVSEKAKKYLYIFSALYGFLAFVHVRFSSESFSGTFCFLGISLLLLLDQSNYKNTRKIWVLLMAGFSFGLGYLFRMQVAIIPVFLLIWCLWAKKLSLKDMFPLIGGGFILILLGILSDKWFYGEWVNTAYNYFHVNIIENKAAHFGVMPWYGYLVFIFQRPSHICGLLIIFIFIYYWIKFPKSIFTAVSLPFFLIHSMIGHKELRFLFPLANLIPLVFVIGFEDLTLHFKSFIEKLPALLRKYAPVTALIIMAITNTSYCTGPERGEFEVYKYINDNFKNKDICLVGYKKEPLGMTTQLPMLFYKPQKYHALKVDKAYQLDSVLHHSKWPVYFIWGEHGLRQPAIFDSVPLTCSIVYSSLPEFFKDKNFNHWQDRTTIWRVYKCSLGGKE